MADEIERVNPVEFKPRLEQRLLELHAKAIDMQASAEPVELDQTRMGRLSRISAIQSQAMAHDAAQENQRDQGRLQAALQRIDAGSYGLCQACNNPIPEGRLEFDLAAEYCVTCASQQQR